MHTISNKIIGCLVSFKDAADETQKTGRIIAITDSDGQIQIYVAQVDEIGPQKIHYLGLHQVRIF